MWILPGTVAMIRPSGRRVLIKIPEITGKIGLIHIPESARRRPQEGEVLAVGTDVQDLRVGDRVLFSRFSGIEFEGHGIVIWEKDVIGVIDP